jgi:hypothetical protein
MHMSASAMGSAGHPPMDQTLLHAFRTLLRPPLPRRLASVCVHPELRGPGLPLGANIVRAIAHKGPSVPLAHQDSAQILAGRSTDGDSLTVAVAVLVLADDRSARSQCLQPGRSQASRWPAIRTILLGLGRVDAPESIGDPVLLERVAVGDGLGRRRRRHDQRREQAGSRTLAEPYGFNVQYQVSTPTLLLGAIGIGIASSALS